MDATQIFPRGGSAYPFRLSEYECVWLDASERVDGEMVGRGGFVAVRVDSSGDDTKDWLESDVSASTTEQATEIARALIAAHEDEVDAALTAPDRLVILEGGRALTERLGTAGVLLEQHPISAQEMTGWGVGGVSDSWTEEEWEEWIKVERAISKRIDRYVRGDAR